VGQVGNLSYSGQDARDPAPPWLYDNIDQIRAKYEKCFTDYQADRTPGLKTLTTASFFGGLGLVLLVAMLGLMRIVSGVHLWISAIGATTCCLIVGAILMDPGRLTPGQDAVVRFSFYAPPAPAAGKSAQRPIAGMPSEPTDFVKTLLWRPLLIAGPDGKASVSFKFPEGIASFRVTVDAHGDGRIGSLHAESYAR